MSDLQGHFGYTFFDKQQSKRHTDKKYIVIGWLQYTSHDPNVVENKRAKHVKKKPFDIRTRVPSALLSGLYNLRVSLFHTLPFSPVCLYYVQQPDTARPEEANSPNSTEIFLFILKTDFMV